MTVAANHWTATPPTSSPRSSPALPADNQHSGVRHRATARDRTPVRDRHHTTAWNRHVRQGASPSFDSGSTQLPESRLTLRTSLGNLRHEVVNDTPAERLNSSSVCTSVGTPSQSSEPCRARQPVAPDRPACQVRESIRVCMSTSGPWPRRRSGGGSIALVPSTLPISSRAASVKPQRADGRGAGGSSISRRSAGERSRPVRCGRRRRRSRPSLDWAACPRRTRSLVGMGHRDRRGMAWAWRWQSGDGARRT